MTSEERISTIIDLISDQIRLKTDLSTEENLDVLSTALNQVIEIFNNRGDSSLSDPIQRSLLYCLVKTLDLCIKQNGDKIVFNFEISYLCIQSIQQFRFQYQDIVIYLGTDLTLNDSSKSSVNFLDVSKKYLNSQIPALTIEVFLSLIQEIAEFRSNLIYEKIGIDTFTNIFDQCEKTNQNKIVNIIKKMVQACQIDSSFGKYLDKLLSLTLYYFDQIRVNDIANDLISIQINIIKNIFTEVNTSNTSANSSQEISTQPSDVSTDIITYEYLNPIFKLLMKLTLPIINSPTMNISQKAFKYDNERKFFIKLIFILIILCNRNEGFRYVISFIQSPPDEQFDPNSSSQFSQSSQVIQTENIFDLTKILYIFRDKPDIILSLIYKLYKGVYSYIFNNDKLEYDKYMEENVTDENKTLNEGEDINDLDLSSLESIDMDDKDIIDTIAFISKSIQPILFQLISSNLRNQELFRVLKCFCFSLDYNIPEYSKLTNLFLFILQDFAFNPSKFTSKSIMNSSIINNNNSSNINNRFNGGFIGRFNGNFNPTFNGGFNGVFNAGFGGGFHNNFNSNFYNGDNHQITTRSGRTNNNNKKNMYNFSNTVGNIRNKQLIIQILLHFKNYAPIIDSFFIDILQPNKNEHQNQSYMDDFTKLQSMVDEYSSNTKVVKYTKTKLEKLTLGQIIDLIEKEEITKVQFLKQGFVDHCIKLIIDIQNGPTKNKSRKKIENEENLNDLKPRIKTLINYCFNLMKIIPINSINTNPAKSPGILINELIHRNIYYNYKQFQFQLIHFHSLSMVEALINLKEKGLNLEILKAYSSQKPEIMKLVKTKIQSLSWPSQFAIFYRAFNHPLYDKKAIIINGRTYSHMDSQYRVIAEQQCLNSMNIHCSAVNEKSAKKSAQSNNYSILTIPEMQVKNIEEFASILALLTKLHEVFVSDSLYKEYYRRQFDSSKNNYIDNFTDFAIEEDENTNREVDEEDEYEYSHRSSEEEQNEDAALALNQNQINTNRSNTNNNHQVNTNRSNTNNNNQNQINHQVNINQSNTNNNNQNHNHQVITNRSNTNNNQNQLNNNDNDNINDSSSSANDDSDNNTSDLISLDDVILDGIQNNDDSNSDDEDDNELSSLFVNNDFCTLVKFLTFPGDVISLKSSSHATILNYPFLFPFNVRVSALKLLFFHSQSAISLCEREFRRSVQSDEDEDGMIEFDDQVIHLVVDRPTKDGDTDEFFRQGCGIMRHFAQNPEMFDVEFRGEKGIGKGPTHEFYTLFSRAFCESKRKVFRNNSSGLEAEAQAEAKLEAESQIEEGENIDLEIDLDGDNNNIDAANDGGQKESPQTTAAPLNGSNGVQYCLDKLGMFPSFDADPKLFEILGIFCAKAIFMECIVDIYFNPAFFKLCRNKKIKMSEVDPQLAISLSKKNDFIGFPSFEYMDHELVKNGSNIKVTDENVDKFIYLIEDLNIGRGIKKCVDNFLKGFCKILPFNALNMFTENEISLLLGGSKSVEITNEDFAKNIMYESGYQTNSKAIVMFKELIMNDMNDNDRQRLIQFITGFNRLPIGGISALKPKLTISKCFPSDTHFTKAPTKEEKIELQKKIDMMLPTVSTCINKLRLPSYSSKEIMLQKLNYCMSESGGFQLI